METEPNHICPVERAGSLDNRVRHWLQDPWKILRPWVDDGMTAVDLGCGPGFFTLPMAQLVGGSGRVIAADLQEGMLDKVREKIRGTEVEPRVELLACGEKSVGLTDPVDFVLAFYMVHEVPDQSALFVELEAALNPHGRILVVEPPFHVSRAKFERMVGLAMKAGLQEADRPRVRFSKSVVLQKR